MRSIIGCVFAVSCTLAQTTPTGVVARGTENVRDFGARGNGVTNDTEAIRRAITASCQAGAALTFAEGTYLIAPIDRNAPIFEICSDLTITGPATLKIADKAGAYTSIFDHLARPALHDFHISNLTIDMNSTGNPLMGGESQESLGKFPRVAIRTGRGGGKNNSVDHVHVTDIRSEWVFFITSADSLVTHNLLDRVGGGAIDLDSSLIYCEHGAAGCTVSANVVVASSRGAGMARTAIEVQDRATVTNNRIQDMLTGENLVGATGYTVTGTSSIGNIITGAYDCIVLWSSKVSGATGYGLRDTEVHDNICLINQQSYRGVGGAMSGIILIPGATLPFAQIKVNSNLVYFDLSNSESDPINDASIGIGYWDDTNTNACDQCDFSHNIVVNAPAAAYRFSAGGRDISFDNEIALNPGSSLNQNLSGAFRSGFMLGNASPIEGVVSIRGGIYADSLPLSRMAYGIAIASSQPDTVLIDGATISCHDSRCASLQRAIQMNIPARLADIQATVDVPVAAALPNRPPAPGSGINSIREGIHYEWNGSSWSH